MAAATPEANPLVRDKLQELASDLCSRGFQLETGARTDGLLWARRGELTMAVLVTDRAPRSLEDLALRISLGDWAEGHRNREFVFVRCFSQWQARAAHVRAKPKRERLRAIAANLAACILPVLCRLRGQSHP